MTTTTMNLPAAIAQIHCEVRTITADLTSAQNECRALLGLPALPADTSAPVSLGDMLGQVRNALAATVSSFAKVREVVQQFVNPAPVQPFVQETPAPINGHEVKPEAIPQPITTPTIIGNIQQPHTIAAQAEAEQRVEDADLLPDTSGVNQRRSTPGRAREAEQGAVAAHTPGGSPPPPRPRFAPSRPSRSPSRMPRW